MKIQGRLKCMQETDYLSLLVRRLFAPTLCCVLTTHGTGAVDRRRDVISGEAMSGLALDSAPGG
jgi:hypothetical protein